MEKKPESQWPTVLYNLLIIILHARNLLRIKKQLIADNFNDNFNL